MQSLFWYNKIFVCQKAIKTYVRKIGFFNAKTQIARQVLISSLGFAMKKDPDCILSLPFLKYFFVFC